VIVSHPIALLAAAVVLLQQRLPGALNLPSRSDLLQQLQQTATTAAAAALDRSTPAAATVSQQRQQQQQSSALLELLVDMFTELGEAAAQAGQEALVGAAAADSPAAQQLPQPVRVCLASVDELATQVVHQVYNSLEDLIKFQVGTLHFTYVLNSTSGNPNRSQLVCVYRMHVIS
jgi:hypothetical protein